MINHLQSDSCCRMLHGLGRPWNAGLLCEFYFVRLTTQNWAHCGSFPHLVQTISNYTQPVVMPPTWSSVHALPASPTPAWSSRCTRSRPRPLSPMTTTGGSSAWKRRRQRPHRRIGPYFWGWEIGQCTERFPSLSQGFVMDFYDICEGLYGQ